MVHADHPPPRGLAQQQGKAWPCTDLLGLGLLADTLITGNLVLLAEVVAVRALWPRCAGMNTGGRWRPAGRCRCPPGAAPSPTAPSSSRAAGWACPADRGAWDRSRTAGAPAPARRRVTPPLQRRRRARHR